MPKTVMLYGRSFAPSPQNNLMDCRDGLWPVDRRVLAHMIRGCRRKYGRDNWVVILRGAVWHRSDGRTKRIPNLFYRVEDRDVE